MDILIKAKERVNLLREKGTRLICALGGRIEGAAPLSKEESVAIRKRAAYCILCSGAGFLFSGTTAAFGTTPFALALLCSAGYSGAFFVYIGTLAGSLAFSGSSLAHVLIYTLALVCRIVLSPHTDVEGRRLFEETRRLRVLVCAACAFLLGIYSFVASLSESGVRGIFALLFVSLCTPLLTWLFCCAERKEENSALHEAGVAALLFVAIYSLSSHTFFGYSFALSVSFLIILAVGNSYGSLKGALCGLICGIATGINPVPFTVGGFASGAFKVFGTVPGVFVALAGAIGSAIYLDGLRSVVLLSGDIIFSCLIYIPLAKTGMIEKIFPVKETAASSPISDAVAEEKRRENEKKHFAALSKAFDELSRVFVKLSGNLRNPGLLEIHELCESVFDRYCKKCALVAYCRQKNYEETHEAINLLAEGVRNKGYLEKTDAPEYLARRCRNIDKIIWDINRGRADMVEAAVKKDKTELFALDYEAISELLRESGVNDGEFTLDSELQNKAAKIIRSLGISSMAYGAWGERSKTILASGVEIGSIAVSSEEIQRALENGTGLHLTEPEFNFSGEFVSMTLTTKRRFGAEYEFAAFCAAGEEISGDKIAFFSGAGDYAYATLCDGMGSGRAAASVSEISSMFFEKMLSAGNCIPVTLKLLSNFIRARNEEYHCTADILQIDLLNAKASFIKCGAPPSYILRGGNIFKIDARSMPLGLTKEINAEKIEMQLVEGDIVIIVSDGVAPDLEDALWLPELLSSCKHLPPKELAESIARRAKAENAACDDISVMAVKITKEE